MKNKETERKVIRAILLTVAIFVIGYTAGFSHATGSLPTVWGGESIAPPAEMTRATLAEVKQTVAPVAQMDYGEGFNCVDYAWEAMRRLHWAGQVAMIARLDLEPGPDHAVLIIPTSDAGWVFIEPQTGQQIYPTPGGMYIDFTVIKGVYVMRLEWTDIDTYALSIAEGVVDTSKLSYYADTDND